MKKPIVFYYSPIASTTFNRNSARGVVVVLLPVGHPRLGLSSPSLDVDSVGSFACTHSGRFQYGCKAHQAFNRLPSAFSEHRAGLYTEIHDALHSGGWEYRMYTVAVTDIGWFDHAGQLMAHVAETARDSLQVISGSDFPQPGPVEDDGQNNEDFTMETNKILNLLDKAFFTIKVDYDPAGTFDRHGKLYTFKLPEAMREQVKPGDYVVIDNCNGEMKIVRCIFVDETPDLTHADRLRWAVTTFSRANYRACLERDEKIRGAIIKKEQDAKREEMEAFLKEKLGFTSLEDLGAPALELIDGEVTESSDE